MTLEIDVEADTATVTLDRRESRNALSDAFLQEIVNALRELAVRRDVGCVVIKGQDGFFSAGADLCELAERDPLDVFLGHRAELWRALREIRVPLVAAVSGHCLGGGCELAMSCDVVIASRSARFGQPETRLGLIPGGGGSQLLVHLDDLCHGIRPCRRRVSGWGGRVGG
jgi:enoyl-CoA hydratase